MQSIEDRVVSKICSKGRGWAFTQIDFSKRGSRQTIDTMLHELCTKGMIRRISRGLYDFPKYSGLLEQTISPDFALVAKAIAWKNG